MSYRMRISDRSRKAGRFVSKVHKEIQQAFVESGLKQQQLAERLGVNRSVINRQLLGESNLTLRTIADLAWALERDIDFGFNKRTAQGNLPPSSGLASETISEGGQFDSEIDSAPITVSIDTSCEMADA